MECSIRIHTMAYINIVIPFQSMGDNRTFMNRRVDLLPINILDFEYKHTVFVRVEYSVLVAVYSSKSFVCHPDWRIYMYASHGSVCNTLLSRMLGT
eukprot:1339161-Amorphochlora_amoeboformis.AAC.2